ncbi:MULTISPECIES: hypothetical protein [Gordonia]|uniref:Uncharacterized protein n=1 Tax=Gordonia sputi NBRC 100414 TaxID=1089453 RepID=H5TYF0_9ACTN|nr:MULTISPECIES: hypothetical protein [Gordonia]NKY92747.1 hypothetical protein [Gordonia sputi]OBA38480.1 hypothetical protein A5766_04685 [Gordonia sp. 852002-51296_SCH5728562-b]GAB38508.1 hypothetical protein GOSPT_045_01460 [Gordonia sputi NBRC 100414]
MPYTPPSNVHRISTRRGGNRIANLGYVDRNGVYRFRDGRTVQAAGYLVRADGTRESGTRLVIVQADGTLRFGPGSQDGQDSAGNTASGRHSVDSDYQATYDANPDAYDALPLTVFTVADGA